MFADIGIHFVCTWLKWVNKFSRELPLKSYFIPLQIFKNVISTFHECLVQDSVDPDLLASSAAS